MKITQTLRKSLVFPTIIFLAALSYALVSETATSNTGWPPNLNDPAYFAPFNPLAAEGNSGECTWYVYGRAKEKLDVEIGKPLYNAQVWWTSVGSRFPKDQIPLPDSVAVWSNSNGVGHVAFVEDVVGDTVYFSEANWPPNPLPTGPAWSSPRSLSKAGMQNRGGYQLLGYIHLIQPDKTPPTITIIKPSGTIGTDATPVALKLSADYLDSGSGINISSVSVLLDGNALSGCNATASNVTCSVDNVAVGEHTIKINVSDNLGNAGKASQVFQVVSNAIAISRVSTDSSGNELTLPFLPYPQKSASTSGSVSTDGHFVAFGAGLSDDWFTYLKDTQTGNTTYVATNYQNDEYPERSFSPFISSDGHHVGFTSYSSGLVPDDSNGGWDPSAGFYGWDVFVKDVQSGQTARISTATDGTQSNAGCYGNSISADGRYVAFESYASNLVPGDNNGYEDVFVKDTQTGTTTRLSTTSSGTEGNQESRGANISADGRYAAFYSWASNLVPNDANGGEQDVFLKDTQTGAVSLISTSADGTQGNHVSDYASMSADGRFVSFTSAADNLVPGDNNGTNDIFVKDIQTGAITLFSASADGSQGNGHSIGPSISANGRFVSFASEANNLVSGDSNSVSDVFVKDTLTGVITRVSRTGNNIQGNNKSESGSISADGSFVAFTSSADNLSVTGDSNGYPDIFLAQIGFQGTINPNYGPLIPGDILITADPGLVGVVIPGKWKHVGMYIGYGNVVESNAQGVHIKSVSDWMNPKMGYVDYLRVSTDQATRDRAVAWATTQSPNGPLGQPYDWNLTQKNENGNSWYCSELVWAAYRHASSGQIDLANGFPGLAIPPSQIAFNASINNGISIIGGHHEKWWIDTIPVKSMWSSVTFGILCPVDPEVTDPQGRIINQSTNQIPGALYGEDDINGDGVLDHWVTVPEREYGNYQIRVIPHADASSTDTFKVQAWLDSEGNPPTIIANETLISNIPAQPYIFNSLALQLALSKGSTYWASYAAYLDRELSVDLTIRNIGGNDAYGVTITRSSNTNGVSLAAALPATVGDINAGMTGTTTLRYSVPAGVSSFRTSLTGSAMDASGTTYLYP